MSGAAALPRCTARACVIGPAIAQKEGRRKAPFFVSRRCCADQNAIVAETAKRWSASFLVKFWLPLSSVS